MNEIGTVFWLTGLSGSGKSTIGAALVHALRQINQAVIYLDGDDLREVFEGQFGHHREDRLKASLSYSRLCQRLASQGIHVVCATISLFHETQRWNRENIFSYFEVFVDVPLAILRERDPKKIYSNASKGVLKHVVGIDIAPEYPQAPDLHLENYGEMSPENAVSLILDKFNKESKYAFTK